MPSVVFTLGTDHHPFGRLVGWADLIAERYPDLDVLVQHGRTPPPTVARAVDVVSQSELRDLMRRAAVVVAQGGPGGIVDARNSGRRPVVVPRDPALGEIVDGHQVAFARHMHEQGLVHLAETAEDVERSVLDALERPREWAVPVVTSPTSATAAAVAAAVTDLLRRGRR